jgi:hypothetical protein
MQASTLGTRVIHPHQAQTIVGRGGARMFLHSKPDLDSESDSYNPTRECFNIDGAVAATDDTEDAAAGARAPAAGGEPRTPGNEGQADPPS